MSTIQMMRGLAAVFLVAVVQLALVAPVDAFEYLGSIGTHGSGQQQLSDPRGVAGDRDGRVWVADEFNNRVQVFTAAGNYLRTLGSQGSGPGQFVFPTAVGFDGHGDLYVSDAGNFRVQKFDSTGKFLTAWGTIGLGDGQMAMNEGMAVAPSGTVYVLNVVPGQVDKYDSTGHFLARFSGHSVLALGIASDAQENVYIADAAGNKIVKLSPQGTLTQTFTDARWQGPDTLAVDGDGALYVTDFFGGHLQKFAADGRLLGRWGTNGTGDGQLIQPWGVAVDCRGTVYVSDTAELLGGRGRILKFGVPGTPGPPCPSAAPGRPSMRLDLTPRDVRAGHPIAFRFRVRSAAAACRAAQIRFAGRRLRTTQDGRASVTLRLSRRGPHHAIARARGCTSSTATVRAR